MKRRCPICQKIFFDEPALSREDNKTEICPDCGTRQALDIFGCTEKEKERILDKIHNSEVGYGKGQETRS